MREKFRVEFADLGLWNNSYSNSSKLWLAHKKRLRCAISAKSYHLNRTFHIIIVEISRCEPGSSKFNTIENTWENSMCKLYIFIKYFNSFIVSDLRDTYHFIQLWHAVWFAKSFLHNIGLFMVNYKLRDFWSAVRERLMKSRSRTQGLGTHAY